MSGCGSVTIADVQADAKLCGLLPLAADVAPIIAAADPILTTAQAIANAICGSVATATSTNPTPTATPAVHEEDRDLLSHPLIFRSGRFATWGKDLALKMPSIRDEFGRILDLRWALARDQCASQPICALRVGPNRGKTPKSCPFKNEGIPEAKEGPLGSRQDSSDCHRS